MERKLKERTQDPDGALYLQPTEESIVPEHAERDMKCEPFSAGRQLPPEAAPIMELLPIDEKKGKVE
jgi:hypothetical protein